MTRLHHDVVCVPARDIEACWAIRRQVFVCEQSVPVELEVDGLDPECEHFLASCDAQPVGTARLRCVGPLAKVERVAVLAEWRGRGIGRAIVERLEVAALEQARSEIVLDAQAPVVAFYERLGYRVEGEEFQEAGIPHRRMRKRLG